jgi:hypothetical protein
MDRARHGPRSSRLSLEGSSPDEQPDEMVGEESHRPDRAESDE